MPESKDTVLEIPIANEDVQTCFFSQSVGLEVFPGGKEKYRVQIERNFYITNSSGRFIADRDKFETLKPFFKLYAKTIRKALAKGDGTLTIEFSDGSSLLVPTQEKYESWEVQGPSGFGVVGVPGGIEIFSPHF